MAKLSNLAGTLSRSKPWACGSELAREGDVQVGLKDAQEFGSHREQGGAPPRSSHKHQLHSGHRVFDKSGLAQASELPASGSLGQALLQAFNIDRQLRHQKMISGQLGR